MTEQLCKDCGQKPVLPVGEQCVDCRSKYWDDFHANKKAKAHPIRHFLSKSLEVVVWIVIVYLILAVYQLINGSGWPLINF